MAEFKMSLYKPGAGAHEQLYQDGNGLDKPDERHISLNHNKDFVLLENKNTGRARLQVKDWKKKWWRFIVFGATINEGSHIVKNTTTDYILEAGQSKRFTCDEHSWKTVDWITHKDERTDNDIDISLVSYDWPNPETGEVEDAIADPVPPEDFKPQNWDMVKILGWIIVAVIGVVAIWVTIKYVIPLFGKGIKKLKEIPKAIKESVKSGST